MWPMTKINEIAPDLFRLSVYVPDFDMQFNHFLVRDEEPLLFHTRLILPRDSSELADALF
jgi:hypothetical protein